MENASGLGMDNMGRKVAGGEGGGVSAECHWGAFGAGGGAGGATGCGELMDMTGRTGGTMGSRATVVEAGGATGTTTGAGGIVGATGGGVVVVGTVLAARGVVVVSEVLPVVKLGARVVVPAESVVGFL